MGIFASAVHTQLKRTPANWYLLYLSEYEQTVWTQSRTRSD